MTRPLPHDIDLPPGLSARVPGADDVEPLVALVTDLQRAVKDSAKGSVGVDLEWVASAVTGSGSWTRRQVVVEDGAGRLVAWVWVQDRAAGRTLVDLTVAPDWPAADEVAPILLAWVAERGREIAAYRELPRTQLDAGVFAGDRRLQGWLSAAGYECTRTWLHMTRPVEPADGTVDSTSGWLDQERPGVVVRRVAKHEDGMPMATDLHVVHEMLEESFADHFNSYRESFAEFAQRLREDPGHRWDHWWIAEVQPRVEAGAEVPAGEMLPAGMLPGGTVVSSVLSPDAGGREGSYVDYIGVHRRARGRGVAKALLATVIADARERGRDRVDLEVDADSPTGADELYSALGWRTDYVTESWHATCEV